MPGLPADLSELPVAIKRIGDQGGCLRPEKRTEKKKDGEKKRRRDSPARMEISLCLRKR
jgi:hypothetical protein